MFLLSWAVEPACARRAEYRNLSNEPNAPKLNQIVLLFYSHDQTVIYNCPNHLTISNFEERVVYQFTGRLSLLWAPGKHIPDKG